MPTSPAVRYRISALDPHAHLFEVSCTIDDPDPAGQAFRLPTWIPGSYLIREYARHVVAMRAATAGAPVPIEKIAKDTWRAKPCPGPLTVIAHVYAFDLSVRGAYLDATRGYFNGAAVFVCPDGHAERACELEITAPPDGMGEAWRVATTLTARTNSGNGFGVYEAGNYDELIDHPVEMSDYTAATFEAGGVRHDIAVSGKHRGDIDRVARDLARLCQWHCDLFGEATNSRAPFPRYLFQIAVVGDGYGGLEHRASTSLVCKRDELPQPGEDEVSDSYRRLLGLASHEYFHAWNVKRIKPAAFAPYDLARESYTRQLWAFEGITSYYDDLALVRSGLIARDSYCELLGRTITQVLRAPGRHRQSVAESSFDAWIKYYRQDENSPNAIVSYYAKGSLVALALDLTLRGHGASLDSVMHALWQRYGQTGIGVPEGAIETIASEIAGRDLGDFFSRYVSAVDDPPLANLLAEVGVEMHLRAAEGSADAGGNPGKDKDDAKRVRASIGAKLSAGPEPRLQHVYNGRAAERAGLAAGDVLVAIDGLRMSADGLDKALAQRRAGDALIVHAFRRDELFTTTLTLEVSPCDTCWLALAAGPSEATADARDAWLGPGAPTAKSATA